MQSSTVDAQPPCRRSLSKAAGRAERIVERRVSNARFVDGAVVFAGRLARDRFSLVRYRRWSPRPPSHQKAIKAGIRPPANPARGAGEPVQGPGNRPSRTRRVSALGAELLENLPAREPAGIAVPSCQPVGRSWARSREQLLNSSFAVGASRGSFARRARRARSTTPACAQVRRHGEDLGRGGHRGISRRTRCADPGVGDDGAPRRRCRRGVLAAPSQPLRRHVGMCPRSGRSGCAGLVDSRVE